MAKPSKHKINQERCKLDDFTRGTTNGDQTVNYSNILNHVLIQKLGSGFTDLYLVSTIHTSKDKNVISNWLNTSEELLNSR